MKSLNVKKSNSIKSIATTNFDLKNLDASHSDLRGQQFRSRDLTGADFSCADLEGVDFRGATLARANFSGANLAGADFRFTELTESAFLSTKFGDAKFRYCFGIKLALFKSKIPAGQHSGSILSGSTLEPISPTQEPWHSDVEIDLVADLNELLECDASLPSDELLKGLPPLGVSRPLRALARRVIGDECDQVLGAMDPAQALLRAFNASQSYLDSEWRSSVQARAQAAAMASLDSISLSEIEPFRDAVWLYINPTELELVSHGTSHVEALELSAYPVVGDFKSYDGSGVILLCSTGLRWINVQSGHNGWIRLEDVREARRAGVYLEVDYIYNGRAVTSQFICYQHMDVICSRLNRNARSGL